MNDDLKELFALLKSHGVEFVVIGAHALAFHGRPRLTQDIDLWVNRSQENANRLREALDEFGLGIGEDGAVRFSVEDRQMIRLGAPPNMVDILNFSGSLPFDEVWKRGAEGDLDGLAVRFPSREDLIEMKKAAGRPQDLADIERLKKD